MREGTAEVPHPIADAHLPEAASVFDAAPAFDTALDMVAPQLMLVELPVRHVLLPRELLPQIEINSNVAPQLFPQIFLGLTRKSVAKNLWEVSPCSEAPIRHESCQTTAAHHH